MLFMSNCSSCFSCFGETKSLFPGPSERARGGAGRHQNLRATEEASDGDADAAVRDGSERVRDAVHVRKRPAPAVVQMVHQQQGSSDHRLRVSQGNDVVWVSRVKHTSKIKIEQDFLAENIV